MLPGLLRVKARVGSQLLTGLVRPEVRMIANGSFGKSEAGGPRRFDPWVRGVWLVNRRVTHPLPPPRKKGGGGGMGEGVGGGGFKGGSLDRGAASLPAPSLE